MQKTDDGVAVFKCVECMRAERAKKLGRGREGEVKGEKENRGKAVQFQRGREKAQKVHTTSASKTGDWNRHSALLLIILH